MPVIVACSAAFCPCAERVLRAVKLMAVGLHSLVLIHRWGLAVGDHNNSRWRPRCYS